MSRPTKRSWAVIRQDLTEGKPLDQPYPVAWAGKAETARLARAKYATGWAEEPPGDRGWRVGRGRGRLDLLLHQEGRRPEVVAYLTVEDVRPRVDRARARYGVEDRGEIVSWHRTKSEAGKALWQAVERWRSSRWPVRRAVPTRPREEWSRQVMRYALKDRGTYAGEIRLVRLNPNAKENRTR